MSEGTKLCVCVPAPARTVWGGDSTGEKTARRRRVCPETHAFRSFVRFIYTTLLLLLSTILVLITRFSREKYYHSTYGSDGGGV